MTNRLDVSTAVAVDRLLVLARSLITQQQEGTPVIFHLFAPHYWSVVLSIAGLRNKAQHAGLSNEINKYTVNRD